METRSDLSIAFLRLTVDPQSRWHDGAIGGAVSSLCDLGLSVRVFVWDVARKEDFDPRARLIGLSHRRLAAGDMSPKLGLGARSLVRRALEKDYKRRPFDVLDVDGRFDLPRALVDLGPAVIVTLPDLAGAAAGFRPDGKARWIARQADGLVSLSRDSAIAAQAAYTFEAGVRHSVIEPLPADIDGEARREAGRRRANFYREALALEGLHARTGMAAACDHEWVESRVLGSPA